MERNSLDGIEVAGHVEGPQAAWSGLIAGTRRRG